MEGSGDRASLELDAVLEAAKRAVEIEPSLGKAYLSLGWAHLSRQELIEAELAYRKGMELTTESIDYFEYGLTYYYGLIGYLRKCKNLVEEIYRKDPLHPVLRSAYMYTLGLLGDIQGAEKEYEHGKAIFGDQWSLGDYYISVLRLGTKDDLSISEICEVPMYNPIWAIGRENIESPEEGLIELHRLYSNNDNLSGYEIENITLWAVYFGDYEFTLDIMEGGVFNMFIVWSPVYHDVRQLPRFKEIVRGTGLVEYWKEYGWPDLCRPVGDDDFDCD
jgi:tetratricopeptide (TPR) repeat protein